MKRYDYLIVGAGLFGAVFAHEALRRNKRCLIIDKRAHIGGNVYTEQLEDIQVHRYGAHIFHTNDREVWDYVHQFAEFNRYTNSPIAHYQGQIYNLPFNMNTFYKLWGVTDPEEARKVIEAQRYNIAEPKNLEEQALSLVGSDIYEKLIKGYTEKQWGRDCTALPAFIIQRLPLRFTWDNNYFNDRYQGIPIGGYTAVIEELLDGCDVQLNTDYLAAQPSWAETADKLVYTGMLDAFYQYRYGVLQYRTLRFETQVLERPNFQGNAVVNYTEREVPWTRIIEHKHFDNRQDTLKTVVTREYPKEFVPGDEPYYPVNDETNNALAAKYRALAKQERGVIFGGRLGDYAYYDMWQVIRKALDAVRSEFG